MKTFQLLWLAVVQCALSLSGPPLHAADSTEWSRARLEQAAVDFAQGRTTAAVFLGPNATTLRAQLAQLQDATPETNYLYQSVTFTLAYLGTNYRQNLEELKRPIELWRKNDPKWEAYQPVLHHVPILLEVLYLHNHDVSILKTLFSWHLDGYPADVLAHVRIRLVIAKPLETLQTIRGSSDMVLNTVEAICDFPKL
jgi:hypothetical protein